jgi:hypothetical protein
MTPTVPSGVSLTTDWQRSAGGGLADVGDRDLMLHSGGVGHGARVLREAGSFEIRCADLELAAGDGEG